jgi:hypothetical protein
MYRQIKIHPEDYDVQHIIWRDTPDKSLQQYQLITVTYGTAPASFLATRCLVQLTNEATTRNPHAAEVIARDMYVDDLVTGADILQEAKELQQGVSQIPEKGGFSLHKWCANDASILEAIPERWRECQLPCTFEKHNGVNSWPDLGSSSRCISVLHQVQAIQWRHHKTDDFSKSFFNI